MTFDIRPLAPGDEAVLHLLALEDADFDIDERGAPRAPLDDATARDFLANPAVVFWVARDGDVITGFLQCLVVPLRSDEGAELLLYEIGVRTAWRRKGTGRALLQHMEGWMRRNRLRVVWVGADNQGAVDFYRASGFAATDAEVFQPVYMTRELGHD